LCYFSWPKPTEIFGTVDVSDIKYADFAFTDINSSPTTRTFVADIRSSLVSENYKKIISSSSPTSFFLQRWDPASGVLMRRVVNELHASTLLKCFENVPTPLR
jgi:hypothetical protein